MIRLRLRTGFVGRILSALVIGALLLPLGASAAFPDVLEGYESRRAIEYLQAQGILQGYPDGRFMPAGTINRAEFLKVLVAAKVAAGETGPYSSCFPDVIDEWYAPYVCYAFAQGWVQGYPDGTFGPERPVTFAEALKMLVNVRGYPQAPAEEISRRGLDPSSWFSPFLTTSLLIDVVSYEQVWGTKAVPLQSSLTRGFVAQLLYRSLMAEAALRVPLAVAGCTAPPVFLRIKTFVDVLMPAKTRIFRQEFRGIDASGADCVLAADANPFGRVTPAYDQYFLQPYPAGQPADSWEAIMLLAGGRAVLRGAPATGGFRPEVFLLDAQQGVIRQLPPVFATPGGSELSPDGRYVVYVGSTGRTLEALDLSGDASVVIDAVESPLTFLKFEGGVQDMTVSQDPFGSTSVTYAVYDSSASTAAGYALREVRTIDVGAAFGNDTQFMLPTEGVPADPFAPVPAADDPFDAFGDMSPTLP
jgi:hypothetical protein